jgi:hypothetical protein
MPKKKVFAARSLKDCLPSLPLKTGKQKKENQSFLSRFKVFYKFLIKSFVTQ